MIIFGWQRIPMDRISQDEKRRLKGSDRIHINNILSAVCVSALSVLLAFSDTKLSEIGLIQLTAAIPLLVTSSLSYAKTVYRRKDEVERWDFLGWLTHSTGYLMILNAISILLFNADYRTSAWTFISITAFLYILYSVVDIGLKRKRMKEKGLKLAYYLGFLFLGSVM